MSNGYLTLSKKDADFIQIAQICNMMRISPGVNKMLKSPLWRVFLHISFWLLYLSSPFYSYINQDLSKYSYVILILANLAFLPYYYLVAYSLIPRFFNKQKWPFFIISTLLSYTLFSWVCQLIMRAFFDKLVTEHEITIFSESLKRSVLDPLEFFRMVIVTLIPLSIMTMRRYMRMNAAHANLIKLNTDLELNFLKSQINPHFLFNTLNNIYSLSLQKSDRSPEMILKLSDLMRYMLYECNVATVSLKREIQFLEDYIALEKIRHGDKAEITFTVEGETENKNIPPLLLIPFVENAFKHGINAQFGNAWVHIKLKLDTNATAFLFSIENNKPTLPEPKKQLNGGIGIENAKKRLHMIYPKTHQLRIEETNNTFIVELSIEKL